MEEKADEMRYSIIHQSYAEEWNRTEHLDSKIVSMTGVSGTLMTLFLGLGTFMLEKIVDNNPFLVVLQATLISGLLVFSLNLLLLLRAYSMREYRRDPDPKRIMDEFADVGFTELTLQVTSNVADAWEKNRLLNNSRLAALTRAFHLLQAAVVLVFMFGVFLVPALSLQ